MYPELPLEIFVHILQYVPLSLLPRILVLSHETYERVRASISRAYLREQLVKTPLLLLSNLDEYPDLIGITRSRELTLLTKRIRGTLRTLFNNAVYDLLPFFLSIAFVRIASYPKSVFEVKVSHPSLYILLLYRDGELHLHLPVKGCRDIPGTPRPSILYPRGATWQRHDEDTWKQMQRIAPLLSHSKENPKIMVSNIYQTRTLLQLFLEKIGAKELYRE